MEMTLRPTSLRFLAALAALSVCACASSTSNPSDTSSDDVSDTDTASPKDTSAVETSEEVETSEDIDPSTDTQVALPEYFPGQDIAADESATIEGLTKGVRIVIDARGIPHIYGENLHDILFAQGYITARDRLFQMHTLRMAASGRLGELSGVGSVRGDVFLRTLGLRRVAEKMAERTKELYPKSYAALESFAAGANAYIEKVNAGEVVKPLEVLVYGLTIAPWTPADTMSIVRLQTWDLGFGGVFSEDELMTRLLELKAVYDGTPLEGIQDDVFTFTPPNTTPTITSTPTGPPKGVDFSQILASPFFDRFQPAFFENHRLHYEETLKLPHRAFRSIDFGSNNWVVSGKHTASGKPMVANDTHLALRNPAIFYQVHMTTTTAGGDVNLVGVNFAGAPGITLGSNGFAAWAATVFYSDVTDMYVETLTEDKKSVIFKGEEVPIKSWKETFEYVLIGDTSCEDAITGWLADQDPVVTKLSDTRCRLEVMIAEVPHHGPVVPWSHDVDKEGNPILMTWRWVGFEPTDEYHAIFQMNFVNGH